MTIQLGCWYCHEPAGKHKEGCPCELAKHYVDDAVVLCTGWETCPVCAMEREEFIRAGLAEEAARFDAVEDARERLDENLDPEDFD